ncbi:hypothetical protein EYM_04575 [Ignicoccus islandicus DSM 13165]|uniref:Uncharacterized protein n=1 Tax=Ignicoccus islandicus DSM 13165 TaxID=940295 RepID=A0A0U3FRL8_9CREN|nr:hypothetical protein [Ignicoccus islandicus]ALU12503.1 hypothetical protein EYM_04575 [Ignicoccus islandicus DSM 13165]
MPGKCPFAKVKGVFKKRVVCSVINEEVNHLEYGCLTPNYSSCPIYLLKTKPTRSEVVVPEEEELVESHHADNSEKEIERMVNEHVKKSTEKFKNPLKGEVPRSCYDCVFFSPTTKRCVFLKAIVENPENPPCKEKLRKGSS